MGVVYLGFDPMLDRPVAIKVLKVPDEETRRRFLREARLAARVHHPHIVSIYAVGEHEGNPYLAMEFIAGRTMAQIIRGGEQVPLARKVHWLSELCAGLGHAHQSGIVHRDVKPSNLLIAQSTGTLRLLDFGIAHGNEASGMTMAGMIVGTPQYMSPEQITGQPVDSRSDIFSVGAVAYELLTGRQAFGGDNLYHVSRQIVGEQPRALESFVPDAPQTLIRAIAKCLQKDPASRPENARLLEREFLSIARRLDPEHTLVVLPAEVTVVSPPPRDVTTSRREMMREAEEAIEQGELTTASGLLQKLESAAPSNDVQALRHKLQMRRLELRVQDALGRAEEALQTGSLEESETAINVLAELAPRHTDLERLRQTLQSRHDMRQVASLTSRARQALQQDRLEEAEALVAEALALAPDAADALSVQLKVLDRTRAQRIARLVAQASRALDQEDLPGARRAIDALVKIDPGHRDVARLQMRLRAHDGEDTAPTGRPLHGAPAPPVADTPSGPGTPAPLTPAPVTPSPKRPEPARPAHLDPGVSVSRDSTASTPAPIAHAPPRPPAVTPPSGGGAARPAAAASRMRSAKAAADVDVVTPPPQPVPSHPAPAPADAVLMRQHAARPLDEAIGPVTPRPMHGVQPSTRRAMIPAVAVATLLALVGAGAYYRFATTTAPSQSERPPATTSDDGATAKGPNADAGSVTLTKGSPGAATPVPAPTPAPPPAATPGTVASANPPATTSTERGDPWQQVRQLVARGEYSQAFAATDKVRGVRPADLQAERQRIVDGAWRNTLAARRVAEDLRLTKNAQYDLGVARQAEADRRRTSRNLKAAILSYVAAQTHFMQAFEGNKTAEPEPAPTPAPERKDEEPKADRKEDAPAAPSMSLWSNAEAQGAIARFSGAYVARDMGGLNRLWPAMDPAWRNEFTEAFATKGELVCVFENITIVRTSDDFSVSARLLTQLPGGEQRRRALVITLAPVGDRLVIGNIRVR